MVKGFKINGYEQAERIVGDFSKNERWLRSVVASVTGDGIYADRLDYAGLLREGYRIKGVAKKMLANRSGKVKLEDEVENSEASEMQMGEQLYLFE